VEPSLPFPACLHGVCRDKFNLLLYTINLTVFLLTSPRTSRGLLPTDRENTAEDDVRQCGIIKRDFPFVIREMLNELGR